MEFLSMKLQRIMGLLITVMACSTTAWAADNDVVTVTIINYSNQALVQEGDVWNSSTSLCTLSSSKIEPNQSATLSGKFLGNGQGISCQVSFSSGINGVSNTLLLSIVDPIYDFAGGSEYVLRNTDLNAVSKITDLVEYPVGSPSQLKDKSVVLEIGSLQ
jgi:hypothetical protein